MADLDNVRSAKNYHLDIAPQVSGSVIKGASNLDWGMQNRLGRIFDPATGKTVMLAFDHGYFQGPTSGLERIDVTINPLVGLADAIMCTRGVLRSSIDPATTGGLVLRASGGPSVLGNLADEQLAMSMTDAVRVNAAAVAVQVFVGNELESQSIRNMTRLVDAGYDAGMPVLGVTAVGKELTRDARYLGLATRIIAELGAQVVKTYYCAEDFEQVTAACPVPVIMAGGKKLPERDALQMAYYAVQGGAAGVDMGRNIFQSSHPKRMLAAVRAVVHEGASVDDAYGIFAGSEDVDSLLVGAK